MASTSQLHALSSSASSDSLSDSDNSIWFGKVNSPYQRAEKKFNAKYFSGAIKKEDRRDTMIVKSNVEGTTSDSEQVEADSTAPNSANPHNFLPQDLSQPNSTSHVNEETLLSNSPIASPLRMLLHSPVSLNKHLLRSPLSNLSLPASPLRFFNPSPKRAPFTLLDSPFISLDSSPKPVSPGPQILETSELAGNPILDAELKIEVIVEQQSPPEEETEEFENLISSDSATQIQSINRLETIEPLVIPSVNENKSVVEEVEETDLEKSIELEPISDGEEADGECSIETSGDNSFDVESDEEVNESIHSEERVKQSQSGREADEGVPLEDEISSTEPEDNFVSDAEMEVEVELLEDLEIKLLPAAPLIVEVESQELSGTKVEEEGSTDELDSSVAPLEMAPSPRAINSAAAGEHYTDKESVVAVTEEECREVVSLETNVELAHLETSFQEPISIVVPVIELIEVEHDIVSKPPILIVEELSEIIEASVEGVVAIEALEITNRKGLESDFVKSISDTQSSLPSHHSRFDVDIEEELSQESASLPTRQPSTPCPAVLIAPLAPNFTPSITPISTHRQSQPALTAPSRRQISTAANSSKSSLTVTETEITSMSDSVPVTSSVMESKAMATKVVAKFRPTTTAIARHSPPHLPKVDRTASSFASTLPTATLSTKPSLSTFSSKMVRPVPSKLPTTVKRPVICARSMKMEGSTIKADSMIKVDSFASTSTSKLPHSSSTSRPNSAASSSSNNTLARPRVNGSTAPIPRIGSVPIGTRPVPAIASRALPGPKRVLPGASRVGASSIRPIPIIQQPLVSVVPARSGPALQRSTSTTRLPAVGGVARSRLGPLVQTHSAPALLAPSPKPLPIAHTGSISSTSRLAGLPTPSVSRFASSTNMKSPEKRRGLRIGQTVEEEDLRIENASKASAEVASMAQLVAARLYAAEALAQRSKFIPSVQVQLAKNLSESATSSSSQLRQASKERELVEGPAEEVSILTDNISVDKEIALSVFGVVQEPAEVMPVKAKRTRTKVVAEEPIISTTRARRSTATKASANLIAEVVEPTVTKSRKGIRSVPVEVEEEILSVNPIRYQFNPVPALTQEELTQLTQKNTVKNKAHFNKLDVQTTHRDEVRPPSPSSKVRKTLSAAATKGGREERAKNRRSALRSSIDGTGIELLNSELEAEGEIEVEHFRAAGDEEIFQSPVRPVIKKGRKKSKASLMVKRVKWDRVLIYSSDQVKPESEADFNPNNSPESILKQIPLDSFGNSKATGNSFAKPTYVVIQRVLYKGEDL